MSNKKNSGNRWPEFRSLVVGPEEHRLDKIEARLDDPDRLAEEISTVLPDAVGKTSKKSDAIVRAFTPVVEKSVHESVKKNTKTFANLLYPVIRPAIQKAIANTFKRMIQSFNKAIENSFSLKGLRWRIQSMITRKPFAEVVLLHSLVYSVDQVFLIRKDSGILLYQVQSALAPGQQDGDLVSAMLKAIQDFVQDSFKTGEEGLETIEVGGFSIWIEQGEYTILAGVVRGNAPETFREQLKNALEKLEHEFRRDLERFQGDITPFEKTGYLMEPCLQTEVKQTKKRVPLVSWLLLAALLLYGGYAAYNGYTAMQARKHWTAYLEQVTAVPGVLVTESGRKDDRYYIKGLRDPLAPNPAEVVPQKDLQPGGVVFQWTAYQSLLPRYILIRARTILSPPETVRLELNDGVLIATGSADAHWKEEAHLLARAVTGIREFRQTRVANLDEKGFQTLADLVRQQRFTFERGTSDLTPGQQEKLETFVKDVRILFAAARKLNKRVRIVITGHTDASGTDALNKKIRAARAAKILQFFLSRGITPDSISAAGEEPTPDAPGLEALPDEERRAVTFTVIAEEPFGSPGRS
jgi:OOP family OmpA-OmpF porin